MCLVQPNHPKTFTPHPFVWINFPNISHFLNVQSSYNPTQVTTPTANVPL